MTRLVLQPIIVGLLLAALSDTTGSAYWQADPDGLVACGLLPGDGSPVGDCGLPSSAFGRRIAGAEARGAHVAVQAALIRQALITPGDRTVRTALGAAWLEAGQPAPAFDALGRALDPTRPDPGVLFLLGQAAYGTLASDKAIEAYRQALILRPGWAAAWLRLGQLLAASGDEAAGRQAIARAEAAPSLDFATLMAIGNDQTARAAYQDAARCFIRALSRRPTSSAAANNLGNALKALGRTDEAKKAYERAIALDAANPNPHNALGVLREEQGDLDGALAAFHHASRIAPGYAEAHYNAGALELERGHPQAALPELEAASRLDPRLAVAHLRLAQALLALGQRDQAIARYWQAIALDPSLVRQAGAIARIAGPARRRTP